MSDNRVKFRRIRGRIVPIRGRKKEGMRTSSKLGIAGGATWAGGLGLQTGSIIKLIGKNSPVSKSLPLTRGTELHNRYGGILNRKGIIVLNHERVMKAKFDRRVPEFAKAAYLPHKHALLFGNKVPAEIFEHELGHALSTKKKYSFNRVHSAIIKKLSPNMKMTKSTFAYQNTIGAYMNLGAEAEASSIAMRLARKRLGKDTAAIKKARRTLQLAYGTYVGKAAMTTGLGLGAAALIMRQVEKRKRKNRGR